MTNVTPDTAASEIELKLALPPSQLAALLNHAIVANTTPLTQNLINTYFDTPNGDLAKAQVAVRLRHVDHHVLQTVKTAGSGGGGLSNRQEWEWPLPQPSLDTTTLHTLAPFTGTLASTIEQLQPTLHTNFIRHSWQLEWQGSRVELVLDRGEIISGDATADICELELELKAGEPEALWSLALTLAKSVALRPSDSSKAARGHALAANHWTLPDARLPEQWLHRATVALDAFHDSTQQTYLASARHALEHLANHADLESALRPTALQLTRTLDEHGQPNTAYGYAALTLAYRLNVKAPLT